MRLKMTFAMLMLAGISFGQPLEGTWQMIDEKTCFQSNLEESDTEKELKEAMGASRNAIGKMLIFDSKGGVQETIKSQGKKKGTGTASYKYQLSGSELQFIDKKSGLITQRYIIDELSFTTLRFHNALKDCETRTYTKVK